MIRIPAIVPNSNWSTQIANKYAEIISPIYVKPKPGKLTITGTVLPTDGQTVIFSMPFAQTYTFRTTPTLIRDVQIAGSIVDSVANLISKVQENENTVNVWVEGSNGIVEHKTAGNGNDVATPTGTWAGVTYTTYSGNNGAYDYSGQSYSFSQNAGLPQTIVLPVYATIDNAQDIADDLAVLASSTAVTVPSITFGTNNAARIIVRSDATGASQTLEVTASSGGPLFTVGDFSVGASIGHPASDVAGDDKVVRMYHPADPVFFRNDNRPLIDLADNDKQIHKAFVALKYGYNIDDGTTYAGSSDATTITSPNGITIDGPLYLKSGLFLNGAGAVQMNVTTLNVTDRVITANSGEAGSGVDNGSGAEAGLQIDRGTFPDVSVYWYEKYGSGVANTDPNYIVSNTPSSDGGYWQIDGPIIGTAHTNRALVVGRPSTGSTRVGTVVEFEQVTIGDGTSTFGSFNGTVIDTAIANAIASLPNGGKIFIKRGNYTLSSNITILTDNITIEGEGYATNLVFNDSITMLLAAQPSNPTFNNFNLRNIKLSHAASGNLLPLISHQAPTIITTPAALVVGATYRIDYIGISADFSNIGSNNTVGDIFVATGTTPTSWSGTWNTSPTGARLTRIACRHVSIQNVFFDKAIGSTTNVDIS